jgi:hypothetical protein
MIGARCFSLAGDASRLCSVTTCLLHLLFSVLALQLLLFVTGSMVRGKASRGVLDAAIGRVLLLAQFGSLVPSPCSALGERVSMGGSMALFELGRGAGVPLRRWKSMYRRRLTLLVQQ